MLHVAMYVFNKDKFTGTRSYEMQKFIGYL